MEKTGRYRWTVVALLFFATTINYLDRQIIGLLKPVIETEFNWSEKDYANIVMVFSMAYALGLFIFGRFVDTMGTKIGYLISIITWSLAAMAHGLVRSTGGFMLVRGFLGLTEGGNFPSAIKSIAEWFPKKERALATGIFNSGANIGAVVAPILVPILLVAYGWRMAFVVTGAIGFIWVIFWLIYYEIPARQKRLSAQENAYIHSDPPDLVAAEKPVPWIRLFGIRQTWAFIAGKFIPDPIWWFFLFWLPSYFASTFNIDLKKPSLELIFVYTFTTIGSIGGGWLSGYLIHRNWPVFKARKTAMLIYALLVTPIIFIQFAQEKWTVVFMIALAMAAHAAWSANIFTTVSDMFPKRAVSSVVGIGGMAGGVGSILFPLFVGFLLDKYKLLGNIQTGYNILFVICGFAYLVAWVIIHLCAPRMEKVEI